MSGANRLSGAAAGYPAALSATIIRAGRGKLIRWQGQHLVVLYGRGSLQRSAVGFALRRTVGNAVLRNRCKRVVRHALADKNLPDGAALLCMLRKGRTLSNISRSALRQDIDLWYQRKRPEAAWPVF